MPPQIRHWRRVFRCHLSLILSDNDDNDLNNEMEHDPYTDQIDQSID